MKLAMVYPHPDSEKGISAYSSNLVKNLRKQEVNIEEETFMAGKPLSLIKKLPKLLRYDIIHLQHEYNLLGGYGIPYFFVLFFLGLFKKPFLIITMHTIISKSREFTGSKVKTFLRRILYRVQNWCISKSSRLIVVHAKFFKEILSTEYSIPENKIIVVRQGIIEDIKETNKEQAKKELGLSGQVYLIIGTFVPDHGADIITKQADKIGKTILIVSNPSAVNDRNVEKIQNFVDLNKKIVEENGFGQYVRFDFKEIPYNLWWKYFCACDIVLLPYREGIGSGIFADAMAIRKPVVSSNIKYFREIAEEYGCIKIAKSDKDFPSVIRNVMNPKNYEGMLFISRGCQRYFFDNNLTVISKRYKQIYQSLK